MICLLSSGNYVEHFSVISKSTIADVELSVVISLPLCVKENLFDQRVKIENNSPKSASLRRWEVPCEIMLHKYRTAT